MGLKKRYLVFWMSVLLAGCSPRGCFPNVKRLKVDYPHVIYQGPKRPFKIEIKSQKPSSWVSYGMVSSRARGAIMVSEDWAFFSHHGYDPKQMREALEESLSAGKLKRGASTITQQVAKNIFLSNERSLIRKLRELWIAQKMENILDKRRIFELYLNIAEWDEGIFGIGPAARHYFSKNPAELNAREAAFLAMLLPSPKKYSISYRRGELSPFARRMIRSILLKMQAAGFISAQERLEALSIRMAFERNGGTIDAGGSVDEVIEPDAGDEGTDEELGDSDRPETKTHNRNNAESLPGYTDSP